MSNDQAVFVRGNEHLDRLLSDPDTAADVELARAEIREMDRAHAMSLAMIRKAGAEGARIVVNIHGQEIDLDLASLPHPSRA